jgi:hypothetical protein
MRASLLICVEDPRKGVDPVGHFTFFRLIPASVPWRWTAVRVKVERPQRSEDERP